MEIAEDIALVFNENPEAKVLFDKMSYTHRKEYIRWIEEAKKPETRENRKVKMIRMILDGKKGI
ncbi:MULTISPECIES: YdeI/OmpD-associated family protein [Chryseobacterium]|uniref:YdeI/OmpD-associated family protein n=1 Tax=Chryseobacterium TaxID=59732 RepID=UPI001F4AC931|nr:MULTISPECIES: YdeI/OmpD-associated family protein [Chryseobacterium]